VREEEVRFLFCVLRMVFGGDKFRRGKAEGFMASKKTKVRDENVSSAATAFSAIDKKLWLPSNFRK
jgi:hypothetical protein